MKARAHVYVNGFVQGVFFRHETMLQAKKFGVNGWVRNLRDGRVEAVLEGERENVDKVIDFCRRGPEGAHVTGVEIQWEEWKGEFRGFNIRH